MLLSDIKGIGEKRILALNKQGFRTPLDLMYYFPYTFADTRVSADLAKAEPGETAFIRGTVTDCTFRYLRKGLNMVRARIRTEYGEVTCTWFNQKFIEKALIGEVGVYGTVEKFKSCVSLKAPVLVKGSGIVPLYRPLQGVPGNVLRDALKAVFERVKVMSVIPEKITASFGLPELNGCFRELHFPTDLEKAARARQTIETDRIAYELACYTLVRRRAGKARFSYGHEDELEAFVEKLPYELTADQRSALEEITSSMRAGGMNRLLQGDVGCGKTVVALLAMYYASLNGYQSALMAPTELLASQHYNTALKLFADTGIRVEFLSGSQSKAQRDAALFNLRYGNADMAIGTHALLSGNVTFKNLSLTVTDEQHRFGVNQRGALEEKGICADTLVMSATPIPRTIALTYYGDLEQSVIRTMPRRKAVTFTRLVPEKKRESMFEYLLQRAVAGENAYIVCPRVEEDDDLVSAEKLYKKLSLTPLGPYLGLLHGKQKDAVKRDVMDAFQAGRIRILVTTTVVEVGIDVKEATSMVVWNAERYGLSQLHQLRGRVGRGEKDSYCFLVSDGPPPERLTYFVKCADGFELAEYDFRTRGAGDFIGTRQHGGGMGITAETISLAREIADAALNDESVCAEIGRYAGDGSEMRYIPLN